MNDWLTVAQVAALKSVTEQTVTKALRGRRLPGQKVGRIWLVPQAAAAAWQPGQRGRPRKRFDGESFS